MDDKRRPNGSGGTVTFRPMTAEGAEELGAALAAIDPWAHYDYTPEALSKFLAGKEEDAPRFEILVEGVLAGAISIRKNWLRGPYLQFLGVLPGFQKRGVGGIVLSWFEAEARKDKVRNIWVVASDFNRGAVAFYERFGFVRVATLDGLVSEDAAEILLRKRLTIG
jgi:diamine N-acetyltransferase